MSFTCRDCIRSAEEVCAWCYVGICSSHTHFDPRPGPVTALCSACYADIETHPTVVDAKDVSDQETKLADLPKTQVHGGAHDGNFTVHSFTNCPHNELIRWVGWMQCRRCGAVVRA